MSKKIGEVKTAAGVTWQVWAATGGVEVAYDVQVGATTIEPDDASALVRLVLDAAQESRVMRLGATNVDANPRYQEQLTLAVAVVHRCFPDAPAPPHNDPMVAWVACLFEKYGRGERMRIPTCGQGEYVWVPKGETVAESPVGNWSTSTHCDRRGCDHPSHYAISSERRPTCSVCGKDATNGMGQTDPLDPGVAVLVSFCDAHRPLPEESSA